MKTNLVLLPIVLIIIFTSCKKNDEPPIVYQSTLSVSDPVWYSTSTTGYSCGFNQGKYEITLTLPNYYANAYVPVNPITYPYSLTVDATIQLADTTKLGYCGFIFNYLNSSNYTVFLIDSNQKFAIFEISNSSWSAIAPYTITNAIKKGRSGVTNTIQIVQNTSTVQVTINNKVVGTFSVALAENSKVGLYAQSDGVYFTTTIGEFNNLVMRKL